MKKISFVIAMTVISILPCCAQILVQGSLEVLKSERHLNLVCDFTNCLVDKKPVEYAMQREEDWDGGVAEITLRFGEGLSSRVHSLLVGQYPDAKYTLVYYLSEIDDDQDCKGRMTLKETAMDTVVAEIAEANGSAGKFGSFFNLLGDAFENLGKKIGKLIMKNK